MEDLCRQRAQCGYIRMEIDENRIWKENMVINVENKMDSMINSCSMKGIKPAMLEFPYPPIQVCHRNQSYANLLSVDYCGQVSELSALTQYINNETRLSMKHCDWARKLLEIAVAEMMHLQKLGELICLLGGEVDFASRQQNGRQRLWTPEYLTLPDNVDKMICIDIEGEKAAIKQYRMHISRIDDEYVNAVLARIIRDEEYHILLLQSLLDEVNNE